jgi:hypothetical protein
MIPNYSPALAAEAKALAEARNAAVTRGQGAVTATPSPGAGYSDADPTLGQHGAIVLREMNTGGRVYEAGSFIPGDIVLSWRPANRAALQQQRRVVYLAQPRTAAPAVEAAK